ncbi:MAG: arginine--tRNA ligase [Gammaproteobacteria bacterium]|nr:MAG: arginine--tRNA ligase [Gammaproteobacteria bacterium]
MNLRALLNERFSQAFEKATGETLSPQIQIAGKPEFGDYQANGAMAAAKALKQNPRAIADQVIAAAEVDDLVDRLEVAGPGFINVHLKPEFLSQSLADAPIAPATDAQRVVVDYSSPNLAKEMHVGHLRSTIIGDAIARILEALGHEVIRQNHVGDWGTQFGMLIAYLDESGEDSEELADLETFYRASKQRFDTDEAFAERARQRVVALQAGDPETRALWQRFIDISLSHCQETYDRLDVTLTREDVMAESAYNDDLPSVVEDLKAKDLLTTSEGAECVFLDEFTGKDGKPQPVIVQKSDGGYLYATTDLAAVRYRVRTLDADRALYSTDARQAFHFRQIFAVAAAAGFTGNRILLEHQPFGAMLGRDGKPFKTRDGGVVKLNDLLDEAVSRAAALVAEKSPDLSEAERAEVARVVGIGAVKYADLSKNRTSDYIFDWDQMLSFDGNTAPYLQYAYSRIQSIFRRGEVDAEALSGEMDLSAPEERALAVILLRLQEVLEQVAREGFPHLLCAWLYDLATAFMRFYEACPILNAEEPARTSRLMLCKVTAERLSLGLSLLGIGTVPRM